MNAVIVRGAHLAIVKSMPTEEHVRIHLDGVEYIVTKLKAYDQAKRKESRNKAVSYFKALSNLVIGVDGKGALKMCVLAAAFVRAWLMRGPQQNGPRLSPRGERARHPARCEGVGASSWLPEASRHRHVQGPLCVQLVLSLRAPIDRKSVV